MDGLITSAGQQILALGLPGVLILVLGYIAWDRDKRLQEVNAKWAEQRAASVEVLTKTISDNTNTLERLKDIIAERKP